LWVTSSAIDYASAEHTDIKSTESDQKSTARDLSMSFARTSVSF
jgi:hypothetical protein